jgi:hypothetical protein
MTEEERRKFEELRKMLGVEDDRDELHLYVLERVDDFDDDTIRRIFLAAFRGKLLS